MSEQYEYRLSVKLRNETRSAATYSSEESALATFSRAQADDDVIRVDMSRRVVGNCTWLPVDVWVRED